MSSGAYYAGQPCAKTALLTTGDNSRTVPTQSGTIFDPAGIGNGAGGCQRITVAPLANVVASVVRIFLHDGSTFHFLFSIQLPAQTVSGSVAESIIEQSAVDFPERFPIMVPVGWTVKATVNDTQTGINVTGQGGAG